MLSPSRVAVFAALAGGLMATLQGCGGAGTTTLAPSPPPTSPPAWKWTKGHPKCMFDDATGKKCTQVKTKEALAASLTKSFRDFDPKNPDGKELGVYMTMQTDNLRLYCGDSENGSDGDGTCFNGHADCILSVGLYNSHMMLDGDQEGAHLNTFAHKTTGYIINPKKMETKYAKCAYFFDGASNGKKYWGCGDAGTSDCGDGSAFANQCKDPANPGKTRTCQADDVEVRPRNDCTQVLNSTNPFNREFPKLTSQTPCYYTGPAFRYPDYSKATEENLLKEMVITRIQNENPSPGDCTDEEDQCKDPETGQYWQPIGPAGYCCKPYKDGKPQGGCESNYGPDHVNNLEHQTGCNRMKKWNEVVVDLRPLLEDLKNDPNDVISAFVYGDASAKEVAEKLRREFKEKFGGPGDVPLVFLDLNQNIMPNLKKFGPPFKADMPSHAIETDEQVSV